MDIPILLIKLKKKPIEKMMIATRIFMFRNHICTQRQYLFDTCLKKHKKK